MAAVSRSIRLGTRGSALARWQTDYIAAALRRAWPDTRVDIEVISTKGDQIIDRPLPVVGGKGLFTAELEAALRAGDIDFAVHSLKDLPTESPDGLTIGAIPPRANPRDVLISRAGHRLSALPPGATIGTSSRRRAAQLCHANSSIRVRDIRGNVDTRLKKAADVDGPYDAVVLAHAGIARLARLNAVTEILPLDIMLPAPGQGALAVQCRDEPESLALLEPLNDDDTRLAVTAERAFLSGLGGGCSLPIAAYGHIQAGTLHMRGRVTALNGEPQIDLRDSASLNGNDIAAARALGYVLAEKMLAHDAAELLEGLA